MKSIARATAALLFLATAVFARYHELVWDHEKICSTLLERAKAGEVSPKRINYEALRLNCARTSWYLDRDETKINELSSEMWKAAMKVEPERVQRAAEAILELNYLDMQAHKFLSEALSGMKKDTAEARRHREFELGLLRALARSGSGKSCEEGQVVLDVEEEYFVFRVMGWTPAGQTLVEEEGHRCDRMKYRDGKGETRTIYFDVDIPFENYARGAKPMPEGMLRLMQFPSTLNPEYYRHFAPMADGEIASMKIFD